MKKLFAILMVAVLASGTGTQALAQKKTGSKKPAKTTAVASKKSTKKSATKATTKSNGAFIVISKKDLNKGNKQRKGDMKTPESPAGQPFKITAIQDASTWKHDFKDGRGSIKAYGHWFLRLLTPGHSGIGIHGSTNNESSVPGRASEGCIRLRDTDIITLKENYAYVGMPVIIKAENEGLYPWEK